MISGLGLLLAAVAFIVFFMMARARDRALTQRMALIATKAVAETQSALLPRLSSQFAGIGNAIERVFGIGMRRRWGVSANPFTLFAIGLGSAATLWIAVSAVLVLPVYMKGLLAAAGFLLVPRFILQRQQRRSDTQFAELFPDTVDMIVRIVRAGLPVAVAIKVVGQEAPAPLNDIFRRVGDRTEIGVPLERALADLSDEIDNPDFRFFAVAVALQQSTGGNLAATLETLSQIIRKRRAVRLKARAATAEVRMSGIVLGAIPFFVTGALLLVAPHYLDPLFTDRRGNFILGAALACLVAAWLTMRSMTRRALAA